MAPRVDLGEVPDGHVRIDLRRGDGRVAEDPLDVPDVGAGSQEMRRQRVPERVGADEPREARTLRIPADELADAFGLETISEVLQRAIVGADEECLRRAARELRTPAPQVDEDVGRGALTERDEARLSALAATDENAPVRQIDVGEIECRELRSSEPRRVKEPAPRDP
jgi:hypothetical protein